jgi:retron-type reverse transcriptase
MTVDEFPVFARAHWPAIRQALLDGSYQPSPVRRVSIPKPGGRGQRPLGIPTVLEMIRISFWTETEWRERNLWVKKEEAQYVG